MAAEIPILKPKVKKPIIKLKPAVPYIIQAICPVCATDLVMTGVVYPSNPPRVEVICTNCNKKYQLPFQINGIITTDRPKEDVEQELTDRINEQGQGYNDNSRKEV
jgi:hypothetical protein